MASEEPMNPTDPLIDPEPTEREIFIDRSPIKEKSINKPNPFTGDRKTVEIFLLECQVYLQTNRRIYTTDEDRIAFILSYMNEKEALRWKQTYLRSLMTDDGEIVYPTTKDFIKLLMHYFKPADQARDATHQLNLLRQGKTRRQTNQDGLIIFIQRNPRRRETRMLWTSMQCPPRSELP